METYLRIRKRYIRISDAIVAAWASAESFVLHVVLIVAWLFYGLLNGFSEGFQFLANQSMTIESDILGLLILTSVLRSGKIADAKADTLLRDLKEVDSSLVGLQSRPEEDVPIITQP